MGREPLPITESVKTWAGQRPEEARDDDPFPQIGLFRIIPVDEQSLLIAQGAKPGQFDCGIFDPGKGE